MKELEKGILNRSERLLGQGLLEFMTGKSVIVFGIGGVGSWCAESLVRSGIRKITIVDSDCVCITNCNRQLMATTKTIGRPKVEVLKERLLDINPYAEIQALQMIYEKDNADSFHIENYDYVIDAIDSLKDKIQLITHVTHIPGVTLFSSMGAALRIDPTKIKVAEFWKVRNDTLGAALRKRMRQRKQMPGKKFLCVYSEELPMENKGETMTCGTIACNCPKARPAGCDMHDWNASKAQINGSLPHITGIFGFTLAGLVMQDITKKFNQHE